MAQQFTHAQLAALAHPWDGQNEPPKECISGNPLEHSAILTCDIDDETIERYGGPIWHAPVWPFVRFQAELLLAGVGQGAVFDEEGLHWRILHLRRRMVAGEIKQISGFVK